MIIVSDRITWRPPGAATPLAVEVGAIFD
jgi:hypothetical protein